MGGASANWFDSAALLLIGNIGTRPYAASSDEAHGGRALPPIRRLEVVEPT